MLMYVGIALAVLHITLLWLSFIYDKNAFLIGYREGSNPLFWGKLFKPHVRNFCSWFRYK